jgi:hypothetical protein
MGDTRCWSIADLSGLKADWVPSPRLPIADYPGSDDKLPYPLMPHYPSIVVDIYVSW